MKRAYGSEPVLFSTSPITPLELSAPNVSRKKVRWLILAIILACISGLVLSGLLTGRSTRQDAIPSNLRQSVGFPLYQPAWLPEGFAVDPESFNAATQVVTFTVTYDGNKKLVFSEQPKPSQFDFENFYGNQLTDKKTIPVPEGTAVTGQFEGAEFASIIIDQTWILIRAPQGIDLAQFERIIQHIT